MRAMTEPLCKKSVQEIYAERIYQGRDEEHSSIEEKK